LRMGSAVAATAGPRAVWTSCPTEELPMRRRSWELSGTTVGLAALVSIPHTALKTLVVWGMIVVGVPAATVGFVVAVVNARATAIVEFNSRKVQDDFQRDRSSTVTTSSVELKLDDSIKSRQLPVQRFLDSNDPTERTHIRASAMRILREDRQTIAYAREASSPPGGSWL